MSADELRVNWRAEIKMGKAVLGGRTSRLFKDKVTLNVDRNLRPGGHCELALLSPKETPDGEQRKVCGRAEILTSVLSIGQFQITVRWLDLDNESRQLLDEKIQAASRM